MRSTLSGLIGVIVVSLLVLGASWTSARAQEPTATPTPMMLPKIPIIRLETLPGYGPAPLTVGFLVSSVDPEVALQSFTWNFGDGQASMLPPTALFHTYTTPGSYLVTVTVATADGHQASSFASVVVTQPAH